MDLSHVTNLFKAMKDGTEEQYFANAGKEPIKRAIDMVGLEYIECLVFSAFKDNRTDLDNLANDYSLEKYLIANNIAYKKVIGCYQSNKELSFLVKLDNEFKLYNIVNIINKCKQYKQDSILILEKENKHCNRPAWFMELNSPINIMPRYAGLLREVTEEEALKQDAYTYDDKNNKYFIIK